MTLPELYISAISSPVPIILGCHINLYFLICIGINKDLQYLKKIEIESKLANFIIISLDDDSILMTNKVFNEMIAQLPNLENSFEQLREHYYEVNQDVSNNFPNLGKNFKVKKNYCKKKTNEELEMTKKLNFSYSIKEEGFCEKIIESFKEIIDNKILKKLPSPLEIQYLNKNKKVLFDLFKKLYFLLVD